MFNAVREKVIVLRERMLENRLLQEELQSMCAEVLRREWLGLICWGWRVYNKTLKAEGMLHGQACRGLHYLLLFVSFTTPHLS